MATRPGGDSALVWLVLAVVALAALGAWWNWRQGERERQRRHEERLRSLTENYARVAERVVDLFDAVRRAREGGGRTASAFAAVERAFEEATRIYNDAAGLMEAVRKAAGRGDWRLLREKEPEVRRHLDAVSGALDRLESQFAAFRAEWEAGPSAVEEAAARVEALARRLEAVEARLGFAVPARRQVESLRAFLDRARADLSAGNPVGARHKAEDLAVRLPRVEEDVWLYESAAGALEEAAADLAQAEAEAAARGPVGREHLDAARAALAELRPLVERGHLERFQQRLGDLRASLRAAQGSGRPGGGTGTVH